LTQRTSGEDSSRKSLTFSLVGNACKITWLLLGRKLLNYHQVFGRTALSNRLVGLFKKKLSEDMSSSQLFPLSKIILCIGGNDYLAGNPFHLINVLRGVKLPPHYTQVLWNQV
jgi:hypothetical protein